MKGFTLEGTSEKTLLRHIEDPFGNRSGLFWVMAAHI